MGKKPFIKYLAYTSIVFGLVYLLSVQLQTFEIPHAEYYEAQDTYLYGKGSANDSLRSQIMDQLNYFQEGYTKRDVKILDEYAERLISKQNILIQGTMPREIFRNYEEAKRLVNNDWLYWGDVKFLISQSNISLNENSAWVSTIGYVDFDMLPLRVPLRFTGIMTLEDNNWKFQKMDFSFDLNHLNILFSIFIVVAILIIILLRLIYVVIRFMIDKRRMTK